MPRATCRCGHALLVPTDPTEKVVCPGCGARVRIRQKAAAIPDDGFLRFSCPCGRKLKVDAANPPESGKCPDCGRIVPVPSAARASIKPQGHPEAPTAELPAVDLEAIERWKDGHRARNPAAFASPATAVVELPAAAIPSDRQEVGLRVCPKCGKPVHLGAESCRSCGTPVPKR